jgi:dTDP-4-dehydrorhamnose reductase
VVKRYLVTGAHGQLGREFVDLLAARGADVIGVGRDQLDVTNRSEVRSVIGEIRPHVVVHTAAMTAVDDCESAHDEAFLANALAPKWVVEACESIGATAALFSTDYVFSGELDRPYTEWDATDPRSVYGLSKLGGERAARDADLVVRTSWLCGRYGSNIVKTVLALAAKQTPLTFVTDQIGSPSFAEDVAAATLRLLDNKVTGVAHVTNQGVCSWYEFVGEILAVAGFDPGLVSPIVTAQLDPPRAAHRPKNSALDNAVMRLHGLPETRPWKTALRDVIRGLDG